MHVWYIQDVAADLKENEINSYDTLGYSIGSLFFSFLGLTVFAWPPTLYYISMVFAKRFLDIPSTRLPLTVHVYTYANHQLQMVIIGLLILGLVSCYFANKDEGEFLPRFICLSWVLNIRTIIIASLLFGSVIGLLTLYYLPQLLTLNTSFTPSGSVVTSIVAYLKQLTHHGPVSGTINIHKAKFLYQELNRVSLYLYYASTIGTILAVSWFFLRIRYYISRIAEAEKTA